MKIGFTGTRNETTLEQRSAFRIRFDRLKPPSPVELHHGCCLGADEDAMSIGAYRHVVGHPPTDRSFWSSYANDLSNEVREPKPYLERNKAIVDETNELWAMPEGPEVMRSGTWATIRYARKLKRPIAIFWPDGSVTTENMP
jgi:hypothetical protein